MDRTTIDFGLDLGTTNSSVAVLQGTETEVIKNNDNAEITPSCVSLSKAGTFRVGMRAINEYLDEPEVNAFMEFKGAMGSKERDFVFQRTGLRLKPHELSAEVLKSLRGDVLQQKGEDLSAAVITVPAAFTLDQCDATKQAAELAGIKNSLLLQEPVAAAMAHGFQSQSDRVFWLVYDLGGGTFDAAVIQVQDGMIRVINHEGDNQLGGKLIDWAIVENLLMPALAREFKLIDFHRGNPKWKPTLLRLKRDAEQAKISLSRSDSEVLETRIYHDGQPLDFQYVLNKSDVEKLAEPFILRSISICKKALSTKQLQIHNIEKMILVGGPVKMPYLRNRLADANEGLGLPLDFHIDPLTVVSRGAAVFAGTQRIERPTTRASATEGQYVIELDYKPVGADPEPLIGGRVVSPNGEPISNLSIEFVNSETRWRSGKVVVRNDGTFIANLRAEKGKPNIFLIELKDTSGSALVSIPNRLTYTIGLSITDPPLIHSVGVADSNNKTLAVLQKGSPLPARKLIVHRQAFHVHRGRSDEWIRIPVVEGEHERADRNQRIAFLEISGDKLKRDVPAGSEIEITIQIDQSRVLTASAYIPILDEEIQHVSNLGRLTPDLNDLKRDAEREKKRLTELRQKANETQEDHAIEKLSRLEEEEIEREIDGSLIAGNADEGERDRCHKRLLDLKAANDEIEDTLLLPGLLAEATQLTGWSEEVVQSLGTEEDKKSFQRLRRDLELAMNHRPPDADLLRRKIDDLYSFRFRLLSTQPDWWIGYLEYLAEHKENMTDLTQADLLIAQGHRSILADDLEGLKSSCRQLHNLLPADEQDQARGFGSTLVSR
ncbi:MAG TPA: Hsp70 family protein [Pyrinomonadaceae bacterium]|nr:Hsp70 family protein [Pyrinomonadaceae bacterium]